MPATEATLTIAPCCRLAIRSPTLRATRKLPRRSILISRSQFSIRTRSTGCILPKTPAALTSPVIGPSLDSISAMPPTTAASLATSNGAGHSIVCGPASGSGAMSTTTTVLPCSASRVAVAAPMPRLPPVTRVMPSALIADVLQRIKQPARDQLPVRGDHVLGHGGDPVRGVGIATAQIAACAHQHVDDGFEFLIAVIVDRARKAGAPQDADIGGRDVVEMLLVATRREKLGFVENPQEFRNFADEIEEGAEAFDLLPGGIGGAGPRTDELHHIDSDLRQQRIEQFLAVFEMVVESALSYAGLFGDAGDRCFRIAVFADHLARGIEYFLLGPGVALDAIELCHRCRGGCRPLRHAAPSSSARSTRFSTLPDGFRGRLSRMMSCFGTLKLASRVRQ